MKKVYLWIILLVAFGLFFVSCATQTTDNVDSLPGFFKGLLHGFILLFSFVGSLFTDFKIYSYPNSGAWYDFGFLLGVMLFFGGSGAGAKRKH